MEMARRTFGLLCLLSIAARVALIATTYGTNDVGFMAASVALVKQVGIARAYAHTAMMNHPPLGFAYMSLIERVSTTLGLSFTDTFRGFQVIADIVAAVALYQIGKRLGGERSAQKLSLFLLLSPAAAFVSAFHCNTDATMSALLAIAVAFFVADRPALSGAALAVAGGIKIVPLLLVPLFFIYTPRRVAFLTAFAITAAILFLPPILIGGPIVARVVFGYAGGLPFEWGIPGVAFAISRTLPSAHDAGQSVMKFYALHGRYFVYTGIAAVILIVLRRPGEAKTRLPQAIEIMFLTLLALAPGFGVQYVQWLIAFLPFALSWRGAIAMNAAISVFLFVTYTVWSGGWPWWFADIARPGPHRYVAAVAGCAMWAIVCIALAVALRRFIRTSQPETAG